MKFEAKNLIFPVILQEDITGGYIVTNPAIEGCYSQGESIEEALNNIKEATELCLEEAKGRPETIKSRNVSLHMINLKNRYV